MIAYTPQRQIPPDQRPPFGDPYRPDPYVARLHTGPLAPIQRTAIRQLRRNESRLPCTPGRLRTGAGDGGGPYGQPPENRAGMSGASAPRACHPRAGRMETVDAGGPNVGGVGSYRIPQTPCADVERNRPLPRLTSGLGDSQWRIAQSRRGPTLLYWRNAGYQLGPDPPGLPPREQAFWRYPTRAPILSHLRLISAQKTQFSLS